MSLRFGITGAKQMAEISKINPNGTPYDLKDATARADIGTLKEQKVFSTEEVDTGEKWIDGKTIYQKVINLSNPPGEWKLIDIEPQYLSREDTVLEARLLHAITSTGGILAKEFCRSDTAKLQMLLSRQTPEKPYQVSIFSNNILQEVTLLVRYTK